MKYLDILKEYNRQVVSESKRLDDVYSKLLEKDCCEEKKACDCGKEDCPECGKKVDEGCDKDKQMREFDEGEKEDGKAAKKMLSKEEFFGSKKSGDDEAEEKAETEEDVVTGDAADGASMDENDMLKGGQHNGHVPVSEKDKTADGEETAKEDDGKEKPVSEEAIDAEIKEFFNIPDEGVTEDDSKSAQMSADEIFGEDGKKEEPKEEPVEKKDEKPAEEPEKKEEPEAKPEEKKDEPEEKKEEPKTESVEAEKKSIKELMAEKDGSEEKKDEEKPVEEPEEKKEEPEAEPEDSETKELNESIKAVRQFVKANKKFFG